MDFGVSRVTDAYRTGITTSGRSSVSTRYAAPEALNGEYRKVQSDVYSFGVLMLGEYCIYDMVLLTTNRNRGAEWTAGLGNS